MENNYYVGTNKRKSDQITTKEIMFKALTERKEQGDEIEINSDRASDDSASWIEVKHWTEKLKANSKEHMASVISTVYHFDEIDMEITEIKTYLTPVILVESDMDTIQL